MLKLIHIFGNVLMVNCLCYGRCYVKKLIPLCTFLKFQTHLEENLARSVQNVFDKCSRVLNFVFSRNWISHENHHILGYHTTLNHRVKGHEQQSSVIASDASGPAKALQSA